MAAGSTVVRAALPAAAGACAREPDALPKRFNASLSVAAVLALLLGFWLRTRSLGTQSFWVDEAISAVVARRPATEILAMAADQDFHPPLHYLLFHVWRRFAGESEYALRFTAAIAGTATIVVAVALARRLFGPRAGAIAAALAATAPFLVYYSTEARMYALAALAALVALYVGNRAAADARWWPLFGMVVAIGLYNFYYAALVVLPVGCFVLTASHRRPRVLVGFAGGVSVALVLYLPWVPILLDRIGAWTNPWASEMPPQRSLAWTWPTLLTGIPSTDLWHDLATAALLAGTVGLAFWCLVTRIATTDDARRRAFLFATAAWLLPLAATVAIAAVRPIYHPRYAIVAAPGLIVWLAGLLAARGGWRAALPATLAMFVAAAFGVGLWRLDRDPSLARDDYRTALGYASSRAAPTDIVLSNINPAVAYYGPPAAEHQQFPSGPYDAPTISSQLEQILAKSRRIWYLRHDLHMSDPEEFVDVELSARARIADEARFGNIKVGLYEVDDEQTQPLDVQSVPEVVFGDALDLTGIGPLPRSRRSGEPVAFALEWQVTRPVSADLLIVVSLVDASGDVWARSERRPRDSLFRTAVTWVAGERVTTGHVQRVPIGTPPGTYRLRLEVLDENERRPLAVRRRPGMDGDQSIEIGSVAIERNPNPPTDSAMAATSVAIDQAVTLAGARLGGGRAGAGTSLGLELLWRSVAAVGRRDSVVRLLDPTGKRVADARTPAGGRYPSEQWAAQDLVRERTSVRIPPTLPSGPYHVWVGMASPDAEPVGGEVGIVFVEAIPRVTSPPRIDQPIDVDFGDGIRLAGWSYRTPPPGLAGTATLVLVWRATGPPSRDYKVFNHVVDQRGATVAQHDGMPAGWSRPTSSWIAGEWIVDEHTFDLPATTGRLRVRSGLYDPETGRRLTAASGGDFVEIPVAKR